MPSIGESIIGRDLRAGALRRRLLATDAQTALWAAVLGAGIVLVAGTFLSAKLNIWIDEAFTLHTTGAGGLAAWDRSIEFEAQPPLYFVLEAAWRTLSEGSIVFARLPSVIFAAAAGALIVGAAHRIAPRLPPVFVALATGVNPLFIWAAAEMRVYALVLFIGTALTWLFFEAFLAPAPSRHALAAYTAVGLIGLYTQYYIGFVLVAHFFSLVAVRRGSLRAFVISMVIVALGFAPFIHVAMMHVAESGSFVSRASFIHAFHDILNIVFVFVLPHETDWTGFVKAGGFLLAGCLLVGLIALGKPVVNETAVQGIVLEWFFCLAIFSLLFSVSGTPIDPERHLVILAPPSLLVAFVLLSALTRRRVLGTVAAGVVFVIFAGGLLWAQYRPPLAKRGDWQRVAALLSAAGSSTPIAVFPAEAALPLGYYLRQASIPIPRSMPFDVDYVRATTLTGESDVARVLDPVHARSPRLWIVTSGVCDPASLTLSRYNCSFLEEYLVRRYRLLKSVTFRGSLARLYARVPNLSSDRRARDWRTRRHAV